MYADNGIYSDFINVYVNKDTSRICKLKIEK